MGPDPAAILAQPPALGFELARAGRDRQRFLRQTRCPVLRQVKLRKILPDYFRRRVALESLCPGVPARDRPDGVEHENRVVGNRLDEYAIALCIGDGRAGPRIALHHFPCTALNTQLDCDVIECSYSKKVPGSARKKGLPSRPLLHQSPDNDGQGD